MSKSYSCESEKKIVAKIAKDLGITIEQVLQIVDFQRTMVKETMEAGIFEGIRLPYLGKFIVKQARLIKLNNKKYYGLIHGEERDDCDPTGIAKN